MRSLVVDTNVAFATLLSEELTRLGHQVTMCDSGEAALSFAERTPPDLVLLDMGLEAPDAPSIARALRLRNPGVRLMVIPIIGEIPEPNAAMPPVQGVLPKPFFLPELPDRIEAALAAPIADPPLAESVEFIHASVEPAGTLPDGEVLDEILGVIREYDEGDVTLSALADETLWREASARHEAEITALLHELAYELGADGVLLSDAAGLIAAVGLLAPEELEKLSAVVLGGWKSALEVGRILGHEQLRFEQSLTGGEYTLYAVGLDGGDRQSETSGRCDVTLALAVAGDTPLGLLRHWARATSTRIADLILVS